MSDHSDTAGDAPAPHGTGPLAGITVVSIEQAVAAPFASRQLADLGARVIKVERPDVGDFARNYDETVLGESSYFVWLNRSKESLTLDFSAPEGRAVLDRLLASADVFIQNLGPGAAERVGLGAATLADRFPQLVVCDLSGYGSDGPWSDRKAYDLLVQCEAGLLSLTGTEATPSRVGISIADIAAGMYAYSGVLSALYRRETTGEISHVEVSLFDALSEWMGAPAYYTRYGGQQPRRVGAQHATIAPYGPYDTGDGSTVVLSIQNEREWVVFCTEVLGQPTLADDPRFVRNAARVANRPALNGIIARRFAELTVDEALTMLTSARIANAQQRDVHEFLRHPVLAERDRWQQVESPGGRIEAMLPPVRLSGVEPTMGPIPRLGAHSESILAEYGASAEDIERMKNNKVI